MVQGHVAAATQAAGSDLKALLELCKPAPADRPRSDDAALARLIDQPAAPPGKAFDNLYFVGDKWVSTWAINTSQGIILIDALNSGKEAAKLIERPAPPWSSSHMVTATTMAARPTRPTSATPAWWRVSRTGR